MFDTGYHNFQYVKKYTVSVKCNKVKHRKQPVPILQNQCHSRSSHITAFLSGEETFKIYSLSNSQYTTQYFSNYSHQAVQHIPRAYLFITRHPFMGNRWGNSGNSVRLYFWGGLQNRCRW